MARPISDEELQLKKRARRRLIGAIVLVSAVAVILPMVLDNESKLDSTNVDIQIPSPDSGEFKPKSTKALPGAAEGTPIKGMPPASAKTATPGTSVKSDSVATGPKADAPTTPIADPGAASARNEAKIEAADSTAASGANDAGKAAKSAAKAAAGEQSKAKDSASAAGAYVVQVAALADTSRVQRLQKQMAGAGVKTYTEVVSTKAGEVTRVRAGPYPTREAAESARTQLKKAGLDGTIIPK
jgi:DedD protein